MRSNRRLLGVADLLTAARGALLALPFLLLSACGGGPPFNSYDPPPTFAFRYVASDPRLAAEWAGATLNGVHVVDLVDPTFTTEGYQHAFNQYALLGRWYTVEGARWPARWQVSSYFGCGAGTSATADIRTKLPEFYCVPRTTNIGVSPSSYATDATPTTLVLQFSTAAIPAGTPMDVWTLIRAIRRSCRVLTASQ